MKSELAIHIEEFESAKKTLTELNNILLDRQKLDKDGNLINGNQKITIDDGLSERAKLLFGGEKIKAFNIEFLRNAVTAGQSVLEAETKYITTLVSALPQSEQAIGKKSELETQKYISDNTLEATKAKAAATVEAAKEQAKATKYSADVTAGAQVETARIQADADRYAADKDLKAKVKSAELSSLTEDQKTLDANEIKAVSILVKYAAKDPKFLTNPEILIDALNSSRDRGEGQKDVICFPPLGGIVIDHSDAMELEKALKGDGKLKKADGKIDMETIIALTAVITENKKPLAEVGTGLGGAILVGKLMDAEDSLQFTPNNSPLIKKGLEELLQH